LKDFAFCILSRNAKAVTDNFIISWDLKTAKIRVKVFPAESFIHSKPNDNPPTTTTATDTKQLDKLKGEIESLKRRKLLDTRYEQYLQMYYETERTGYTLRDYFEERGLFDAKVKLAFFAVDEFGIMVYRICERLGIKFTALVSDINRNIEFKTHGNTTESLPLESLANIDKSLYTNVFMATVWNGDQIEFVKKHCPRLFLFDAVMQSMYTRAFFINKIRALTEKNIGIKTGIFFTPYIHQIPGEHSELEEYFRQQGQKMSNIMNIQDEKLREKAKDACYRVYGFDDGYIESVCNFGYPIELHNGVYLMRDYSSKYVNVVNHRRLTTDTPEKYQNTIYFFGDSMVTGLHVGDAETIESNLQRIINDNNLPFCVQNCANSYGLKYDWIFTLADTMSFAPGDILLFCTRLDWLTEQYVKQNNKNLLQGALGVYTADAFKRPHEHGELFTDDHHNNGKGYGLIARKIFDELNQAGYFDVTSLQGGGETAAVQQLMVPPPHVPRS
jgi:hypothetical protein